MNLCFNVKFLVLIDGIYILIVEVALMSNTNAQLSVYVMLIRFPILWTDSVVGGARNSLML